MAASLARRVSRFFKRMGLVGYSKRRNIFGIHPLVISTTYIILALFLAALARKVLNLLLNDSLFKRMILEFIATLELCAACFELIIVADNWGIWAYALYLFILTIWWSSSWDTATACPYSPIEEILEGSQDVSNAALLIFSQILGALVTFRYVQILWAMELVETHRSKAFEDCMADLQVHMLVGAVIEAGGTCLCRLASRVLSDTQVKFANVLDAFFATMMVVAAFNFSGGYYNPALATSLKLGCEGNTFVEHLVVYWIGATIGSVLSVLIFKSAPVQEYMRSLKTKVD
ncbi:aquaporin-11 [Tribolium madens]|uniref:aquaporin-11 n=1 Tax=Tribolium madens TaxID=41895 RepID=UPI001CF7564D|nr:aquaporin-11 [Tribolium madens]